MNHTDIKQIPQSVSEPDSFEKGRLFEDYIVTLFNKRKFTLLEWRSDKRASNGVLPFSCRFPDLEFAYMGRKRNRFAVECKFRQEFINGKLHWAYNYQIENYKEFQYQNNITVFIAIGVGGDPSNPDKLFLTPLDHISMYSEVFKSRLIQYEKDPSQKIDTAEQLELF